MKKKFSDKLEKFLVLNTTFLIMVYMAFHFIFPIVGVWGYFIILIFSMRLINANVKKVSYYWDHPEVCPTVDWCEKLTMRLFANGKIRKN